MLGIGFCLNVGWKTSRQLTQFLVQNFLSFRSALACFISLTLPSHPVAGKSVTNKSELQKLDGSCYTAVVKVQRYIKSRQETSQSSYSLDKTGRKLVNGSDAFQGKNNLKCLLLFWI